MSSSRESHDVDGTAHVDIRTTKANVNTILLKTLYNNSEYDVRMYSNWNRPSKLRESGRRWFVHETGLGRIEWEGLGESELLHCQSLNAKTIRNDSNYGDGTYGKSTQCTTSKSRYRTIAATRYRQLKLTMIRIRRGFNTMFCTLVTVARLLAD